jgi:hypothetical protein
LGNVKRSVRSTGGSTTGEGIWVHALTSSITHIAGNDSHKRQFRKS